MEKLYLSSNQIGASGAQALANALPQCGLPYLNLSSNQIGDSGAQALANALPQCGLEVLYLLFNPIGDSVQSELKKMSVSGSNPLLHTLNREGHAIEIWV